MDRDPAPDARSETDSAKRPGPSRAWPVGFAVAVGLAALAAWYVTPNNTPSVPPGIYLRVPLSSVDDLSVGDYAIACVPPGPMADLATERDYLGWSPVCPSRLRPLVKRVAALAGDTVRVAPSGVTVGGRALSGPPPTEDRETRPIPPAYGTYALGPGQVWLASDLPNGFDSRYLGPFDGETVRGEARLVYRYDAVPAGGR